MAINTVAPTAPTDTGKQKPFLGISDDYYIQKLGRNEEHADFMGPVADPIRDAPIAQADGSYKWLNGERVYVNGDEYRPSQGADAKQIRTIQEQLIQAGLIPKGKQFSLGKWDEVTRDAYKKLLEYANGRGVTDEIAIGELMTAPLVNDDADTRSPLTYQLPDPEDLKATLDKTSRSVLGRKLDPASLDRISQAYLAELRGAQETNYNNAVIEGATQMEMPTQGQFAEDQIRASNPGEATAHDFSGQYDEFEQLLTASESNVKQY